MRCLVTGGLLSLVAQLAFAQTGAPCDASVPVRGCRAEVRLEGKFIVLTSDTPKCSVIEWTLDGRGRQTTVTDGEERLELLTTRPQELSIDSCTEVKDLRQVKTSTAFYATCKYDDADMPIEKVIVRGEFSSQAEKVAAAERACEPVLKRADYICQFQRLDSIVNEMDAIVDNPSQQSRWNQLNAQYNSIKQSRPAYCGD